MVAADAIKASWDASVAYEVEFWRSVFEGKNPAYLADMQQRLDPATPLVDYVRGLLPPSADIQTVSILDIGAGPASSIGWHVEGRRPQVTAIDALASQYRELLDEFGHTPPVYTQHCDAEAAASQFSPGTFDLVHIRNALDQCYDPLAAMRGALTVLKPGGVLIVCGHTDEGEHSGYNGLQKWNVRADYGDMVIWRPDVRYSVRDTFGADLANIAAHQEGRWTTVTIKKASSVAALIDDSKWPLRPPNFEAMARTKATRVDILDRVGRSFSDADMAIHTDDEMWNGFMVNPDTQNEYTRLHYAYGGRSALNAIASALILAQAPIPTRILDFPCGHGRVLRYLIKAFPDAEIWGGDLNRGGVDFCVERFGAIPVYSDIDLSKVWLPGELDLIWCGSLATHLQLPQCEQLVDNFVAALAPGGIAGITFCSRGMDYAQRNQWQSISPDRYAEIQHQVAQTGAGFAPYPGQRMYGMTFVTLAWIQRLLARYDDAYMLAYVEKGWHGTQDILWLVKRPLSHCYDWERDD